MRSTLRVTCLVDNYVERIDLLGEHGLSYLVELDETRVLFDTGGSDVITRNADTLGVGLSTLHSVVLSHGHRDHTGGLPSVLNKAGPVTVFCHPLTFEEKLAFDDPKAEPRRIGTVWSIQDLERKGVRFDCSTEPRTIAPGLRLTGQIPRVHPQEPVPTRFQRRTEAGLVHDELLDDQCLIVETARGIVVVLGCTHSGVINTLDYVGSLCGNEPIRAITGGLHLIGASPDRIRWTVEQLRQRDIEFIGAAHCTGLEAYRALAEAFADRCHYFSTGSVLEFD